LKLSCRHMMLCDFHVHSTFSDGRLTIAQLVDLYGQRGFGAIAITDHLCEEHTFLGRTARFFDRTLTRSNFAEYLRTLDEQAERAWDQYRMLVIPGYELTKNALVNDRSAHVVVLGSREFLAADQDIVSLLGQVRESGGLSIAAHPVNTGYLEPQTYFLWSRRRELANHFDAWEVASGPKIFDQVLQSGLPMIANSDLHHPRQINSWKTKLHCERHPQAIFEAIRKQQVDFVFYQEPVANPLFALARG
jgi:hypothetical protein